MCTIFNKNVWDDEVVFCRYQEKVVAIPKAL